MQLVEQVDGHTDIAYGSFDPKYFKRYETSRFLSFFVFFSLFFLFLVCFDVIFSPLVFFIIFSLPFITKPLPSRLKLSEGIIT